MTYYIIMHSNGSYADRGIAGFPIRYASREAADEQLTWIAKTYGRPESDYEVVEWNPRIHA